MNPNNLVRPPVIQNVNQPPAAPNANQLNPDMEIAISQAVRRICLAECQAIVPNLVNPRQNIFRDQEIDEAHRANLGDLDKVPDVVRCLREFSGDPKEFASWKKSVDRIIKLFDATKGTPKYFAILNVIRNKIVGHADTALESYNTPLNWEAISICLETHYADKRDLGTLEYQMSTLTQGSHTIEQFYQEVYAHLTLILNKIGCMKIGPEAMQLMTETYRNKALDTFIRGLRGDLPRLLGTREPTDLPQALHLCLKLENQNYRTQQINKNTPPHNPRRNQNNGQPQFYPHLAHFPQNQYRYTPQTNYNPRNQQFPSQSPYNPFNPPQQQFHKQQNNYPPQQQFLRQQNNYPIQQQYNLPPPRPFQPKPPTPMDVDRSLQTARVNYVNRPQNMGQAIRRQAPVSNQLHQTPAKFQRINQIESTDVDEQQHPFDEYYAQMTSEEEELQPINKYLEGYDEEENKTANFSDIHFLD